MTKDEIREWLSDWLADHLGISPEDVETDRTLARYGLEAEELVSLQGDLEEALGAANAIGDDRLQRQAQGYVVPDSFTHGTSEQRARWFRLGFETGDVSRMMETFKVSYDRL